MKPTLRHASLALPLIATFIVGCSSVGIGIGIPIGRMGGIGVSVGSDGTVGGSVGVGSGGVAVGVGGSTRLPAPQAPASAASGSDK